MTRTQYRKNYASLVRSTAKMLRQYGEAALKSGALDLKSEQTSFRLPKNVITAALHEIIPQWSPHPWNAADKKQVNNLRATTYPNFTS